MLPVPFVPPAPPAADPVTLPADVDPERMTVTAVRTALDAAERTLSPAGALALGLAGLIDEGGHTAAGVAALSRELRATLAEALAGAQSAADRLDELAARRSRKASGA
jgi:hypothetical protein